MEPGCVKVCFESLVGFRGLGCRVRVQVLGFLCRLLFRFHVSLGEFARLWANRLFELKRKGEGRSLCHHGWL